MNPSLIIQLQSQPSQYYLIIFYTKIPYPHTKDIHEGEHGYVGLRRDIGHADKSLVHISGGLLYIHQFCLFTIGRCLREKVAI